MKKNVGPIDRIVRIIIGAALIGGGLFRGMWLAVIIGSLVLVTGLLGWCGMYTVLGMNTCPTAKPGEKK